MDIDLSLLCECASFPLVTEEALGWRGVQLERDRFGVIEDETNKLADFLDRRAVRQRLGLSR